MTDIACKTWIATIKSTGISLYASQAATFRRIWNISVSSRYYFLYELITMFLLLRSCRNIFVVFSCDLYSLLKVEASAINCQWKTSYAFRLNFVPRPRFALLRCHSFWTISQQHCRLHICYQRYCVVFVDQHIYFRRLVDFKVLYLDAEVFLSILFLQEFTWVIRRRFEKIQILLLLCYRHLNSHWTHEIFCAAIVGTVSRANLRHHQHRLSYRGASDCVCYCSVSNLGCTKLG